MINVKPLQFEQQIHYFNKKLNIATDSYLDVWNEEHDYMFMVAGANRNDMVADFREAIRGVIEDGITFEEFRDQYFDKIVAKYNWHYTGGRNWRASVIYNTNLLASYNKGRLVQQLALKEIMPYWEYQHNDSTYPRHEHKAWDGLILRYDDPWWRYHYPIKVYGSCYCSVISRSEDDLKRMGRQVDIAPEIEWEERVVGQRSGSPRTVRVVKGCDPGFGVTDFNNLNADRTASIDKVLMHKLVNAEPRFAATAIRNILNYPQALALLNKNFKQVVDKISHTKQSAGEFNYVGILPEPVIDQLNAMEKAPQSAVIAIRGEDVLHALRDNKASGLQLAFWEQLPSYLLNPDAVLLENNQKLTTLLFVYKTEHGKVAVKIDYELKLRNGQTGKKERTQVNIVRTGSAITNPRQWESLKGYQLLFGSLD